MRFFLLVYDRTSGTILEQVEFDDEGAAMQARFDREDQYARRGDVEVVVLGAASLEQVKLTHGRYFMSDGEPLRRSASAVRSTE